MVNAYLQSVYDTVVVKDIVQWNKLRKFDTLQRVVNFLYDSIGSEVSPDNIADTLSRTSGQQLSHNTVLKYLRYFTESYLIYPVRLYNIKGKRLLASNYKYYAHLLTTDFDSANIDGIRKINVIDWLLGNRLD